MSGQTVVVIGAGPAGLTAALMLSRQGIRPVVLEKSVSVGGIARTEVHRGYRFDLGGHRFFTKDDRVRGLWEEVMGDDFLTVSRLSRIYYGGRFFDYPIELFNALRNLGFWESVRIVASYLSARLRPFPEAATFEEWVVNRFGRRLYEIFFQGYTEKVWGIPGSKIHASWAAQRIRSLTLVGAVANALFGTHRATSLIREFSYPVLGPGMMWERFRSLLETAGAEVRMQCPALRLNREGNRIRSVVTVSRGLEEAVETDHVISSMPLPELVLALDPPAPGEVLEAAAGLRYRSFLLVGLIVNAVDLFPDNWIYVNDPAVAVGRVQNFGNWSAAMVPVPHHSALGLEYFCDEGDRLWLTDDGSLIDLAARELDRLGLGSLEQVEDGAVFRQPKAYPIYDDAYQERVDVIRTYLATIENLQTIGRNGMHRYNNMDHSMLTAMLAAENVAGAGHDPWTVNVEPVYHEGGDGS